MIENEIIVEIDGKQHKNWKSYDIDSDFLIPADSFSFDLGKSSEMQVLPNFSGKKALVKINGQVVLTGIVDTTQHRISKGGRSYTLNGRDLASVLLDCSAPITNVKGLSVLDAVKKIATPLGIKEITLKAENNPKLDKVDIDVGETAWDAIIRCANSAGLHCWFEPNGTLIVGGADYSSPPVATLCVQVSDDSRNNFTEASLSFDVSQSYSEVTFLAQKHGRDIDDAKHDFKWVYKNPELNLYKPKTVVLSDVDDLASLKKQAKKQISDWQLESFDLSITVPDHKTRDGILWQPGQRIHVICEEYDIDAIFFLMGRRFMLSRHGGTQTELRLKQDGIWTPDAYKAKAEKARKRKGKKSKGRKQEAEIVGSWELDDA
ncbi:MULTISPECIES: phage baseplate assembly protein [Glaesserella]|uniref:Phage tail protein n=1 Tax=Glaesserella australis TaxID=2094024 RepID=A0A328BW23_9PAST|nr:MULTISPECIES: phage tail protein [Glaesserella]AUI66706.1 phage tail protein [Glaesserella sp. 15-184]RAL17901.1 phage tail protein [Glaesserella australis]